MFNLDAFVIRGHEKVIGHYRRMRDSRARIRAAKLSETHERRERLEHYLRTRLSGAQAVA